MHKLFVFGIDGANLDLILRWKDELPNLRRLIEGGVYGKLESTIPVLSSPAWNCMFTGKNPGKIGIFGFLTYSANKKTEIQVVNYSHQDSHSVWDLLGAANKKVVIVNVPTYFPPTKVNGCVVCGGLLASPRNDDYTFPPELGEELNAVTNGYERIPFVNLRLAGKEKELLEKFGQNIEKQLRAVKWLMQKFDWDFLAYVVFVIDPAQHYFWHHIDKTHPMHNAKESTKWENGIKDIYKKADEAIGELISGLPDETNILVVSDHGFGALYGYFHVNEWLKENGFLEAGNCDHNVKHIYGRALFWLRQILEKYGGTRMVKFIIRVVPETMLELVRGGGQRGLEADQLEKAIDWSQTRAYTVGTSPFIFINLKSREDNGIVAPEDYERLRDEIMELLYQVRDPRTGRGVVEKVFRGQEIYSGRHMDIAPDIAYISNGYDHRSSIGGNRICSGPDYSGTHRLYGTFIGYGPDIRSTGGELHGLSIYDITPTILHLMDCPVPQDVDGRVLTEMFSEDSEPASRPIAYQKVDERDRIKGKVNKIKNLGKI